MSDDTEDLDALAEHVNHLQNRVNRLWHLYGGNHDQLTHGKLGQIIIQQIPGFKPPKRKLNQFRGPKRKPQDLAKKLARLHAQIKKTEALIRRGQKRATVIKNRRGKVVEVAI